jgi:hypothetical protein
MACAWQGGSQRLRPIRALVEANDDPGTFCCEQLDNSGTDAATAACDDCGFALKGEGERG